MSRGAPSAITLRIRAMAKIERLKDKITRIEHQESERAVKSHARVQKLRDELDALAD